jgi:hypothetical protein
MERSFLSADTSEAKTIHEAEPEIQNLMAVQTAITGYNQLMKDALDKNVFSDEELEKLHEKCYADTIVLMFLITRKKLATKSSKRSLLRN